MSWIRIESIEIENYRSFGENQIINFPEKEYGKPVSIIGYNNVGKTNLMNAILYGVGIKYISQNEFNRKDLHNLDLDNNICIKSEMTGSEFNSGGWTKSIRNNYEIKTQIIDQEVSSKVNPSFFGMAKHYNIFYINFHEIKKQISTKKTSWGNLTSFLAKHIQNIVNEDSAMVAKKDEFEAKTKGITTEMLENTKLSNFIDSIKENYSTNLRDNNCVVEFGLPDYEDIFLKMVFKIGLNSDMDNLIPLEHFGDGYISMFVMAVIQAIAETEMDDKCLFLFEEPESFLHENHQQYFYNRVLCNLANRGHQVIYTTHSARMIDIFDTKSIVKLNYNDESKKTEVAYNNINEIVSNDNVINIRNYNEYIKTIEPNLNKILFSNKVILVEGPNDMMTYEYIIKRFIKEKYMSDNTEGIEVADLEKCALEYAQTYMNFENIVIVPHHGKSTVYILAKLCEHFRIDYFIITDLDLDENQAFVEELASYEKIDEMQSSSLYKDDTDQNIKGLITTNWKIIKKSGLERLHFNIKKLEDVFGYGYNDKRSDKIWNHLQEIEQFNDDVFPDKLKEFILN